MRIKKPRGKRKPPKLRQVTGIRGFKELAERLMKRVNVHTVLEPVGLCTSNDDRTLVQLPAIFASAGTILRQNTDCWPALRRAVEIPSGELQLWKDYVDFIFVYGSPLAIEQMRTAVRPFNGAPSGHTAFRTIVSFLVLTRNELKRER